MDPFAPVSGMTVEKYADLSAEVASHRGDAAKVGEALGKAGVSAADWADLSTANALAALPRLRRLWGAGEHDR